MDTCCIDQPGPLQGPASAPGLPEGVPPLRAFYLYMTTGCNLRCRHCWITPVFANGEPSPGDCIDPDVLQEAVREAKPLGLQSVKLTGGEPLMHPQFRQIAEFLAAQGIRSDMETNGTHITPETARFLKERTAVHFISVSLDSIDAARHDDFRGVAGAFEAAVAGIANLVSAGYRPQVIMSLHRDNLGEIDDMVDLATRLGADSVKFNPITNAGRGKRMHEQGKGLDYDQARALLRYVHGDLRLRSRIRLFIGAPPALLTVDDLLRGRWRGQCNVGAIMGVLGTGHVALCGIGRNVPELCYGRLGKDHVGELWLSNPFLAELRAGLRGPFPGICGDCIHAGRCRTGCLAMNYMYAGRLFAPSPWCEEAAARGHFPPTRRIGAEGEVYAS